MPRMKTLSVMTMSESVLLAERDGTQTTAAIGADVCEAIAACRTAALIPHVNADGDALGSVLALQMILAKLGKRADVFCPTPVVKGLRFLKGADKVKSAADASAVARDNPQGEPYDLVIAVDAADCARLGDCVSLFDHARKTAVIDHHSTNDGIAQYDWIDKDAAATGVLIFDLACALGVSIDSDIADCLFTAVSTDTGNFSQRNTTSKSLRVAAACIDAGTDVASLTERLYKIRSPGKTALLARALDSMRSLDGGRLISMRLSHSDFVQTGTDEADTEGLIDFGIAVQGSLAAVLASERCDGVKVSMRARPPVNVAAIAACLNGGGHALAAGCTVRMPLGEASALLEERLSAHLNALSYNHYNA